MGHVDSARGARGRRSGGLLLLVPRPVRGRMRLQSSFNVDLSRYSSRRPRFERLTSRRCAIGELLRQSAGVGLPCDQELSYLLIHPSLLDRWSWKYQCAAAGDAGWWRAQVGTASVEAPPALA